MGQPIPLLEGAYTTRSTIADAQRCINLYTELNPKDSPFPTTHYLTPGLTKLGQAPNGGKVRGLYTASTGDLYAVVDSRLFFVDTSYSFTLLGSITAGLQTPVSMNDNQQSLVVADGSPSGWEVNLKSRGGFTKINDPSGSFVGSIKVGYLDTFFLFNAPGVPNIYSTIGPVVQFNPLFFAAKTIGNDPLLTFAVVHREVWIFGAFSVEIWYDAGNFPFPLAPLPGVLIDYGCAAKYSVATAPGTLDQLGSVFWVAQSREGPVFAAEGKGYRAQIVSTPAIEEEWRNYPRIDDAIGFVYHQEGHTFWQVTFPTADKTWVYDKHSKKWHERNWTDTMGVAHRHRANCHTAAYGINIVGDQQNGAIYKYDLDAFTDDGKPIIRTRSFPHVKMNGARVTYEQFLADMEAGQIDFALKPDQEFSTENQTGIGSEDGSGDVQLETAQTSQTAPPNVYLRWSDDGGKTWSIPVPRSAGMKGEYLESLQWRRLGMSRDRVFELSWSFPAKTALNGAYLTGRPLAT